MSAVVGGATFVRRTVITARPVVKQIRVTDQWSETGLLVEKDRCYRLTVTGACRDTTGTTFEPDGTCPLLIRSVLAPLKDLPQQTLSRAYVGQHPIRAIIARIGDKAWSIHVGKGLRFIAPATGALAIRINEPQGSKQEPEGDFRVALEPVPQPRFVDETGRTTIWAHIDDMDYLLLTPRGLQWEYGGNWTRVGMHGGVFPTLVNGIAWWPDWSDPVRSSVLETSEFAAAAEGTQSIRVTDVVARHGLVQLDPSSDGTQRLRFRDTELGSGDIGCTLVFEITDSERRPGD
jgi:hypothetical protein